MRRWALFAALSLLALGAAAALPVEPPRPVDAPRSSRAQAAGRASSRARACDGPRARRSGGSPTGPRSRSIGYAWQGRLENGVLLRESDHVRYVGEYRERGAHYGTRQLVQLLERAAARVQQRAPGARLSVGELSRRRGGALSGHRSHQNGRDVDLAFYMTDARGHSHDPFAFAAFGGDGVGRGPNSMLRFDDVRNYELLARLVTDADARVQHVFVSNALRARLLRTARARRASATVRARLEQVLVQPTHGHPHANHFHVRIYCSPHERPRCQDRAPFHGWYPGTPPVEPTDTATLATDP